MTPSLDAYLRRQGHPSQTSSGSRSSSTLSTPLAQSSRGRLPPGPHGAADPLPRDLPFGPLRAGAPGRAAYRRGAYPDLRDPAVRQQAVADYEAGFYASSSAPSIVARRRLYSKILSDWGMDLKDFGTEAVHAVGATLRAGGYRSSDNVLSQMKVDAERAGVEITAATKRALTDAARSCRRGLGPPLRAMALDFPRFEQLPADVAPWAPGGPASPRNALIIAGWWMMREIEVSNLRVSCVQIAQGRCPVVALTLPASKTDQAGVGVRRTHTCICQNGAPRPFCPAHCAWDQLLRLRREYAERFNGETLLTDMPFFPTTGGAPCSKEGFTQTIVRAAQLLNQPITDDLENVRISGHSMRPTGAQFLAKAGLDTYTVQLLGRWGSSSVETYVRDAVISEAASRARASQLSHTLDKITGDATAALPQDSFDRALVLGWVRESFGPGQLWTDELLEALVDRVSARVHSAVLRTTAPTDATAEIDEALASSSSDDDGQPSSLKPDTPIEEVANEKRKRRHRVLVGPPNIQTGQWVTRCGWRFGRSTQARLPEMGDKTCDRCFKHRTG